MAQRVDDTADQAFAYFDGSDIPCPLHLGSFLNVAALTHQYHTHIILFKVQCDGIHPILELNQFSRLHIVEAVDAGDTVTYLQYTAYFLQFGGSVEIMQLLAQYS